MRNLLVRHTLLIAFAILIFLRLKAQNDTIALAENLVAEGIPSLPASAAEDSGRYGNARAAFISDWHPLKKRNAYSNTFRKYFPGALGKNAGG